MPTYEYLCADCGPFDAVRRIAERNAPTLCPLCAQPAPRALLTAPAFAGMPAVTRQAHAVNERSRNEPRLFDGKRHGYGCACCGPKRNSTQTRPDGMKTAPNRRPWMISH
jgi:putative FmdB family regulatory protein